MTHIALCHGGGGFSSGVCNKYAIVRRGFKPITEKERVNETQTSYISKFY